MKKFALALFAALMLCGLTRSDAAEALSCATGPVRAEFEHSAVVFRGTALNANVHPRDMIVRFRVKTVWKGSEDDAADGVYIGNMWKTIVQGVDYLVFATYRDGRLEGNTCGNTREWEAQGAELMQPFDGMRRETPWRQRLHVADIAGDALVALTAAGLAAAAYRGYRRRRAARTG